MSAENGMTGPHKGANLQQLLLEELRANPFIDEDLQGFALRLGASGEEVEAAVATLCEQGLLKPSKNRGYVLITAPQEAPAEEMSPTLPCLDLAGIDEDMLRAQGHFQEELFEDLRLNLVEPLKLVDAYLENPKQVELGLARAAMEEVNGFMRRYFLHGVPKAGSVSSAAAGLGS